MVAAWEDRAARAIERYEDGAARFPDDPDERQRQLTRMGNAAWAAGLSSLMLGRREEGGAWLLLAADRYRESWPDAPIGSWGRPIGALKARLVARDLDGARADAEWALGAGAAGSESAIGRYAAVLAHLVRGEDEEAAVLVTTLRDRDDFPQTVSRTLGALAAHDANGYDVAIRALLADFAARDAYLEDVPVADTVLAAQVLAEARALMVSLVSPLLPKS